VNGIVGALPAATVVGVQVALGIAAIRGLNGQIVIVVDVAVRAGAHFAGGHQLVRILKRESRGVVIEGGILPRNGVVAGRAGCQGKNIGRGRVFRIGGVLPGGQVALGVAAIGGNDLQIVVAADVTLLARYIGMAIGERKTNRRRGVVEALSSQPTVKTVATVASLRELCGDVIGIGGVLKVLLVAGNASGGKSLELSDSGALVAIFALDGSVGAKEREAVLVILELLDGNIPALDGVTLSTVGAHLPLVNVGVAVLAVFAYIGENGFDVALNALHFFVHAAQGILGLIVVEFGIGADGPPSRGIVAVFTRDG